MMQLDKVFTNSKCRYKGEWKGEQRNIAVQGRDLETLDIFVLTTEP